MGSSSRCKCLRAGRLQPDQRILIYGASGSIGTAGVQLAKHLGANVTAVCNTENVDVVKSLGADAVIDYTREPFLSDDESYDVIFDAVGKISFGRCKASLKPGGFYVDTDLGYFWQVPALAVWTRFFGTKRVLLPIPRYRKEHVPVRTRAVRLGQLSSDHRPDVPIGRGRRSHPLRRDRAEDRQRRAAHRSRGTAAVAAAAFAQGYKGCLTSAASTA